ncbi:MAG: leucine--tRNA ligase [Candidatus Aenigmarchaeota archaeon]|nr:leucine--tRNA ligase [Candidatus Aenigmarchaeota archaeon]
MDINAIEKKWEKKWEEERIFEVDVDTKKEKLFFTTPYPYISGSLHLGHGRAAVESDVVCRFKRMQGFNVMFPLSFHITGTPVLGISAAIKNGNKKKIKLYEGYVSAYEKNEQKVKDIVKSFEDPQKIVDYFIPKMVDEYKKLGLGVDWRRSFTSGDMEHQKMVTWQFQNYKDLGYLIRGAYPVLYSPKDESAMGEDDIQDADSNPVEKQEFTILKFKFNDKFLVAATLRPETVFGQTNLWVNPETKYHEAKVGNETWILSKEAIFKLKHQRKDVEDLGKTKEKLLGEYATAPAINRKIIILPGRFVDPERGTGIVTCVPSDAPYDYIALKELQENKKEMEKYKLDIENVRSIEIIPIIKTAKYGTQAAVKVVEKEKIKNQDDDRLEKLTQEVYKEGFHTGILLDVCGPYAGKKVTDAKEEMKKDMIEKGDAEILYETSRKAVSRGGGEIIVAVMENQWFLDFNAKGWKDKAYKCLESMKLEPETTRKQFMDVFDWLDKRPCARKRGLGTQLPFDKDWMIESLSDSTIYMTLYTINHLIRKHKIKAESLNHDFFDYVYLGKGNTSKVSESTNIEKNVLEEMRKSFEYWMPVDQRHTFVLHLSNHLSFMIFAHAGLLPEKYWPKFVSFGGLVVSGGEKMSKSKGNVVTLLHVKEKYGADVFRFYLTQAAKVSGTFDWKDSDAENAKKNIEKLYSMIEEGMKNRRQGKVSNLYLSKFNRIKRDATFRLKDMRLKDYDGLVFYEMVNMVKKAKQTLSDEELKALYCYIITDWIKLISPVVPHIAEELWQLSGEDGFVSTEKWPEYDESKIRPEVEAAETYVDEVVKDIEEVKRLAKIENPQKVTIFVAPKWKHEIYDAVLTKTPLKEIIKNHPGKEKQIANYYKKLIKRRPTEEIFMTSESELKVLSASKAFMEKEFGCAVEIVDAEKSKNPKAIVAESGKPGILMD